VTTERKDIINQTALNILLEDLFIVKFDDVVKMIRNEPVGDVLGLHSSLLHLSLLNITMSVVALVNPIFSPHFNLTSIKSAAQTGINFQCG